MQDKENIEELFREAFRNYEEPVRPELWTKISSSLTPATPPTTDVSNVVSNTASTGSGIFSGVGIWIAGAVLVASIGAGVYYLSNQQADNNNVTEQTIPSPEQSKNEIVPENAVLNTVQDNRQEDNQNAVLSLPTQTQKEVSGNVNAENELQQITESEPGSVNSQSDEKSSNEIQDATTTISAVEEPVKPEAPKSSQSTNSKAETPVLNTNVRAYPTSGVAPLMVDFNYDGIAQKAEWNFGDGVTATKANMVQHTFDKPGIYNVTLKVYDYTGKLKTHITKIEVQADLQVKHLPNIFTPNEDGINDVFTFEAPGAVELEVAIYDKTGKFIHKWTGFDGGWDGKLNSGHEAPEGTYFYIIFATGENQQVHHQKGTITLKR